MAEGPTKVDVGALAALAHLELGPEELLLYAQQLEEIVRYADQVQQVETTGVTPSTHLLAPRPSERPDAARPSLGREEALANAPDAAAGLIRVPRVLADRAPAARTGAGEDGDDAAGHPSGRPSDR